MFGIAENWQEKKGNEKGTYGEFEFAIIVSVDCQKDQKTNL